MSESELPITDILVGQRHRREMGDISGLAASIAEVGLMHPIVVTPDGRLIAGERRLRALQHLGRDRAPVTVLDLERVVNGEYAENQFRKAFTPSEAADIADSLEPKLKQEAKERQGERTDKHPGNFSGSSGRAQDHLARVIGKDRTTIAKARAVRDAAASEPERFGKLQADMDRTGRVDGPFKRLKVMRQAAEIRAEPPPFPARGPYRVITADPPWPYELRKADPSHRATHPYPQMSIEQICAMGPDVQAIAHSDCILWLWTTNHHMREAFTVLDSWGFEPRTILTWVKDRFGTGDWLRGQTEHCLFAIRGKPIVHLTNQTTVLHGPMRANSQKPDECYAFIERLCPAPRYAELSACGDFFCPGAQTQKLPWTFTGSGKDPVILGRTLMLPVYKAVIIY
jgi:N6-adenosine-specific RNA methylase IME4